ncbi:hypothetical protein FEM03_02630 [Phragmitibacter flavus]|uniref:Alginate lyase n=1 Tax=Phragmitibacter flavus TaxID=2576071 RepID=A0A5R8KJ30_9BACT|nr:polysaccharide lyase 6 family protein [Phragmitibacter flavus]TLD72270.1 hypothetical protein FEM03_02630 [Phragmitibacter flavus]
MRFVFVLLIGLVAGPWASASAKELRVANPAALEKAIRAAEAGDVISLNEGEWRDVEIVFTGKGTEAAPITLKAATPGKAVLTGASTLRIGGEHLVVEGLLFKDPDNRVGDLILFRKDSKLLANHCRMTQCAVINTQPAEGAADCRWVGIYGAGNRVDHCSFQGKTGKGTTLVVWLGNEGEGDGRHRIDHNYFGPREKLGKNGGETIRIGDSKTSMLSAECVVERNLFEKCNGEVECISNKSCDNVYRENTFLEVGGTLTLRHGNRCTVEKNVFIGNQANGTGGVRIIGEDHVVRGNYLENLTGDDARAGICFMMGIPESPAHRYFQVKRARIEDNVLVNCKHSILIGLSDDKNGVLPPVETLIIGNRISAPGQVIVEARCSLSGIEWRKNQFAGKELGIPATEGIEGVEPQIVRLEPLKATDVGVRW